MIVMMKVTRMLKRQPSATILKETIAVAVMTLMLTLVGPPKT